jgi:hypothetical protein
MGIGYPSRCGGIGPHCLIGDEYVARLEDIFAKKTLLTTPRTPSGHTYATRLSF